jgi:hypothetical protein
MKFSSFLPAIPLLLLSTTAHAAPRFLDDETEPQVNLSFAVQPATTGSLTAFLSYRDARNYYALEMKPGQAVLRAMVNGVPRVLARSAVTWTSGSQITWQRRPWVTRVIVNKRVLLTGYDASFDSGQIGFSAVGGWKTRNERVQPVEDLYFADDFTRAVGEDGEWKSNANWQLTATSDNISNHNAEMSANPFAYAATSPTGPTQTFAGRWFWDNYDAQVSVRPVERGSVGLAVYVQDPKNYLAFVWSATESASSRRLIRVVNGKTTVLAQAPGALMPRQWYRLGMRTSPGYVEAFIDGMPIFRVRDNSFGQGGIGLLADRVRTASFDDVKVKAYQYFRQDFVGQFGGAWTKQGGSWTARNGILNSQPVKNDGGKTRFLIAGRNDWQGYRLIASAQAGRAGACGLVVGYRDDKNYTVFRWAGPQSTLPFRGRQQLMRYNKGKASIISDEPAKILASADKSGFARVQMRLDKGALTVSSGDEVLAQMADETLEAGKPALWSQGTHGSAFHDVVMFFPPEPERVKVAARMEDDALMVGWASPTGEWPPRRTDNGLEFWNTGEFFGDSSVEFDWRRATYSRGRAELALRAQNNAFESGYILRIEGVEDRSGLRLSLLRDGKILKQAPVTFKNIEGWSESQSTSAVPVRVELEGRAILALVAGKPALSYVASPQNSPRGARVAARATGFTLTGRSLRATSTHRDDYTFSEAPTDWYAPSGQWSVISRWPCYSDWSFFGGRGLNPMLWSKRLYSGDTVVEIYAHNQMDLPKELAYSNPGNLNITLGGDGKNLTSGYSFVLAGWDNTRSSLYKGTQMVAENTGANARFERAFNHNANFHKRWYYIRAEARQTTRDGKAGTLIKFSVDDETLAEYFDTNPLPSLQRGGRVAFWTVDSTLMIARAKIESEIMGAKYVPADVVQWATPPANSMLTSSGSSDLVPQPLLDDGVVPGSFVTIAHEGSTPDNPAYLVHNASAGGWFGVRLNSTANGTLRATPTTRLELDSALGTNSRIDLYVTVDGQRYLIALGEPGKPDASAPLLGTARRELAMGEAPPAAGGRWMHISFELGKALQKLYPNRQHWDIESIEMGALHGDEYRWLGFDGNPLGASYALRGVRLIAN